MLTWSLSRTGRRGRGSVFGQTDADEEDAMTTLRDDEILTFAGDGSRLEADADADGDDTDADDTDADADDTDADADDSDADADDTDGS
ncbi:MAG: hypothetical protein ACRDPZ_03840 [Gaiellaceae bacterium]